MPTIHPVRLKHIIFFLLNRSSFVLLLLSSSSLHRTSSRVYPHWNATAAAATAGVKTDKTCCTTVCEEPERVCERPRASERVREREWLGEWEMEWGTYRVRETGRGRETRFRWEDHRAIVHVKTGSLHYSLLFETAGLSAVCAPCILFP